MGLTDFNSIHVPLRPHAGRRIYIVKVEDPRDEFKKLQIGVYANEEDAATMAQDFAAARYHWDRDYLYASIVSYEGMLLLPKIKVNEAAFGPVEIEHDAHSIGDVDALA